MNGSDAADGQSFANRKKTFASVSSAASAGDTVRIMQSPSPTSLGQNATFTNKSDTVTLTSAVTQNIYLDSAWTASANVTCSTTTTRKEGSTASLISIATGFTTGLAAYFATGTLDLSSYQQISFWIQVNTIIAANTLRIDLCSDTAGATPVNSFTIDFALASGVFIPITIDNGAALGSSIQSIALTCLLDPGAVSIIIDNVIACKAPGSADSLTHRSLIGKNTANELWWPIRSINGTTIKLDTRGADAITSVARGYSGTSESITCYKREGFIYATSDSTPWGSPAAHGTSGNLITYSGGWDSTDMSTQVGETYIDALTNNPQIISNSRNFVGFEKLYGIRGNFAFNIGGTNGVMTDCGGVGCTRALVHNGQNWSFGGTVSSAACLSPIQLSINSSGSNDSYNNVTSLSTSSGRGIEVGVNTGIVHINGILRANNNSSDGINLGATGYIAAIEASDNGSTGINISSSLYGPYTIGSISVSANTSYGISSTAGTWLTVNAFSSSGNSGGSAAINFTAANNSYIILKSPTYTETNLYTGNIPQGSESRIQIEKVNGAANTHKTEFFGGKIESETSVRHTASGLAWKLSPTSAVRDTNYPVRLPLGPFGCAAGTLVTISAWVERSNSAISARLVVPGGQVDGVSSDLVANSTGAGIGAYEQLMLTFTPSSAGGFQVYFEAFGGTTHFAYIDNLSVTQA